MELDKGDAGRRLNVSNGRIGSDDLPSGFCGEARGICGYGGHRLGNNYGAKITIGLPMNALPVCERANAHKVIVSQLENLKPGRVGKVGGNVMDRRSVTRDQWTTGKKTNEQG